MDRKTVTRESGVNCTQCTGMTSKGIEESIGQFVFVISIVRGGRLMKLINFFLVKSLLCIKARFLSTAFLKLLNRARTGAEAGVGTKI